MRSISKRRAFAVEIRQTLRQNRATLVMSLFDIVVCGLEHVNLEEELLDNLEKYLDVLIKHNVKLHPGKFTLFAEALGEAPHCGARRRRRARPIFDQPSARAFEKPCAKCNVRETDFNMHSLQPTHR